MTLGLLRALYDRLPVLGLHGAVVVDITNDIAASEFHRKDEENQEKMNKQDVTIPPVANLWNAKIRLQNAHDNFEHFRIF